MLRLTTTVTAAVGIVAFSIGAGSATATAAGTATELIPPMCAGEPVMKVWYDSDQTGSWANAWLETPPSCKGRWAHINLRLYCIEGTPTKPLANLANSGTSPVSTRWTILPKTCKKFRAYGDLANIGGNIHSDIWSWRYGYPPA